MWIFFTFLSPICYNFCSSTADIISCVEFNQDGELLATGDKGGRVVIFKVNNSKSIIFELSIDYGIELGIPDPKPPKFVLKSKYFEIYDFSGTRRPRAVFQEEENTMSIPPSRFPSVNEQKKYLKLFPLENAFFMLCTTIDNLCRATSQSSTIWRV